MSTLFDAYSVFIIPAIIALIGAAIFEAVQ